MMAPDVFLYVASLWDARLSWGFLRDNLGVKTVVDSSKSVKLLHMVYRSDKDTVCASLESLLAHGMIVKKWPKMFIIIGAVLVVLVVLLKLLSHWKP
jgi:hypothetical protein